MDSNFLNSYWYLKLYQHSLVFLLLLFCFAVFVVIISFCCTPGNGVTEPREISRISQWLERPTVNSEITQLVFSTHGIPSTSGTDFHVSFDSHSIIIKGNIKKRGTTVFWNHITPRTAVFQINRILLWSMAYAHTLIKW